MPDLFVSSQEEEVLKPSEQATEITNIAERPKTLGITTSFSENPKGVSFQGQEEGEEILLFLRRHMATNLPWFLKAVVASIIPLLFLFLSNFVSIPTFLPQTDIVFFILFYYLVIFGYVFVNFIGWFYNVSFITNQRIVDVNFSQLVFESVAETKIPQIEDVTYHQVGFLRSMFDFGDITIQTAGKSSNFEFDGAPHPEKAVGIINRNLTKRGETNES